ncbi:hypothetical protein ACQ4PT_043661 [Festuca glaucescens]
MEGESSLRRRFQHVYVRRSRRYVAEQLQSVPEQSTPMPTPLRRSSRVKALEQSRMMMKRKAVTLVVKGLKNRIQTNKVGSEQHDTNRFSARRRLEFEPTTLQGELISASDSASSAHTYQRGSCILTYHRRGFKLMKTTPKSATPARDERITKEGAKKRSTRLTKLNMRMIHNQDFVCRHNDAPSSSALADVTPISAPPKAERTPRKPLKSSNIRLKVDKSSPEAVAPAKGQKKPRAKTTKLVHNQQGKELAIVLYQNSTTGRSPSRKVRVHLDNDTLRVHGVLVQWDKANTESFEGVDIGTGPGWEKTRRDFEELVHDFIYNMRGLFGPRPFSPCEASVIDSVIGTFLTQNVADHLSSDAFMNLAAKYPARQSCSDVPEVTYEGKSNSNFNEASDATDFDSSAFAESVYSGEETNYGDEVKGHHDKDYEIFMENFVNSTKEKDPSTWTDEYLVNLIKDKPENKTCSLETLKRLIATLRVKDTSRWDELRQQAYKEGYPSGTRISDLVDWEAVLQASPAEVARYIAVRGMNYVIACRIQAFLLRIKTDHGNFDLDWLRHVPRESAKNYLTSIAGIGYKSADCIRLLSLDHKAFPVDVNICRICIRLGWVKLQGLPDSVDFHLINLYPILSDVQKYLWPRLCTVSKKLLYELHCFMITFGKVVCTKVEPNCSACPFSPKCKYYNSLPNRALLPPTNKHVYEPGEDKTGMANSSNCSTSNSLQVYQLQMDLGRTTESQPFRNCAPIIEEPPSPVYEHVEELDEQEQALQDDLPDMEDYGRPQESQYDVEIDLCSHNHMMNDGSWIGNHGKDIVNPRYTLGQQEELKNIGRLRTEHYGYVLPDNHIILKKIPFRTAMRGKFPLKGTYFQDHEVFADYSSSCYPISIDKRCLLNLNRCVVYFGSSIQSITKGLTRQGIQECFMGGYVCVRAIDRGSRYPRRLCPSLHATNGTKDSFGSYRKKTTKPSQGKSKQKEPPAGHTPAAAAETEEAGSREQ